MRVRAKRGRGRGMPKKHKVKSEFEQQARGIIKEELKKLKVART